MSWFDGDRELGAGWTETERRELVGRRQRTAWFDGDSKLVGGRQRARRWLDGDGEIGAGLTETASWELV